MAKQWHEWREALIAGLLWAAMTSALMTFRASANVTVLVWFPAGITVAIFWVTPYRRWLPLALLFFVIKTLVFLQFLSLGHALTIAVSKVISGAFCAALSRYVVGDDIRFSSPLAETSGLFFAACAGSVIAVFGIALYEGFTDIPTHIWRFLTNVLGILSCAPFLLWLRRSLLGRSHDSDMNPDFYLVPIVMLALGLSYAALTMPAFTIMPLMVTFAVLVAARYGQMGSCLVAICCGLSSTYLSIGGESPGPNLPMPREWARIAVQWWMLVMLMTSLPIAAVLLSRDRLRREVDTRNDRLHESVTIFGLAEQVAGIGRWRQDLRTGEQEWSPLMLELYGLPRELGPDPGDMRQLLPDGGAELYSQLDANAEAVEPFSLTYRVKPPGSTERILQMSILNEFAADGKRIGVFGVAMDVTQQVHREEALDLARGRAVKLAAEAQKLANTDPLTSLPNRRCTFERLESLIADSTRREFALAAVMFDIDHFKRINDTFGHQTGDEVIVQVSELARRQTRKGDLVGRIGGEEFVWLLPHMNPEAARRSAERLRDAVEKGTESANVPPVTISVGLAMFRAGDTAETLLARADAALYEAKEGGRNMVKRAA